MEEELRDRLASAHAEAALRDEALAAALGGGRLRSRIERELEQVRGELERIERTPTWRLNLALRPLTEPLVRYVRRVSPR